jgi:hypothetical protein
VEVPFRGCQRASAPAGRVPFHTRRWPRGHTADSASDRANQQMRLPCGICHKAPHTAWVVRPPTEPVMSSKFWGGEGFIRAFWGTVRRQGAQMRASSNASPRRLSGLPPRAANRPHALKQHAQAHAAVQRRRGQHKPRAIGQKGAPAASPCAVPCSSAEAATSPRPSPAAVRRR